MAIAREKEIKAWRREKKLWLITGHNPQWDDLASEWFPKSSREEAHVISQRSRSRSLTPVRRKAATAFVMTNCKSGGHAALLPELDGPPDIIIPSVEAYRDNRYPPNKLFMVGIKTTCKDRWRQVLNEAKRIKEKHIMTIQQGISKNQLDEMKRAGVQLIVPLHFHQQYPPSDMKLLEVEEFVGLVRKRLA